MAAAPAVSWSRAGGTRRRPQPRRRASRAARAHHGEDAATFRAALRDGSGAAVLVRPLRPGDVPVAARVLADAFNEDRGTPRRYERYFERQVASYLDKRLPATADAVVLVAVVGAGAVPDAGVAERLRVDDDGGAIAFAGTLELSFSPDAREAQDPPPPGDAALVGNIAVASSLRQRGVGRALLEAAERYASARGHDALYLHARLVDSPALRLYSSAGFVSVDTDSPLAPLLRWRRRQTLMRKELLVAG